RRSRWAIGAALRSPPQADVARLAAGIARCFAPVEAIRPIGTGTRQVLHLDGAVKGSRSRLRFGQGALLAPEVPIGGRASAVPGGRPGGPGSCTTPIPTERTLAGITWPPL